MVRFKSGVIISVLTICSGIATLLFADEKLDNLIETGKYKKAIEYGNEIPAEAKNVDVWVKLGIANEKSGSPLETTLACYKAALKANPSDPRVYIGLGSCDLAAKKYADALKNYQRSYVIKRSAEAAEGIAIVASSLKNWDKARDAAESAIKLDPEVVEARIILTEIYRKENDYKNAATQLEFIVKKNPDSLKYWRRLSLCYEKLNDKEGLAQTDPKIIELDNKDIKSRKRHAEYSLAKKDQATAYTLYKELAILTPNDPEVFKNLYEIASSKGSKDDAILYLQNFLALDSTSAASYKALGEMQYDKKNYDGALDAYRKAIKLDPKIKGFYKNYETIVLQKGLKTEAVKVITNAITAGEADTRSYIALADIYKELKQYNDAIKMYKEALKTDTRNVAILASLGDCQAMTKQTNDAIITYEQVVLLNPGATTEYKTLGDLNLAISKKENGMTAYKKYLEKVPGDEKIAKTIGIYEHEKKQYETAIKYLEIVKDVKLQNTEYLLALGDSYFQIKNYKKATELYAKVTARKVSDSILKDILKPLGESYEKIGNKEKAAESYEAYTKISGVKDADAAYLKAYLREDTDKETAIKIYEANTKSYPQDERNFIRLGLIYAAGKETLVKAAQMLSSASLLSPKDPIVWKTLGTVYGTLKNEDKELNAYQKLLAIEPQHIEANRRVGTILLKKRKYTDAIVSLEIALTSMPKDEELLTLLAEGYIKTKRPDKAVELLLKAKVIAPEQVEIRTTLIDACSAAGKSDIIDKEKAELAELDKKIIIKDKKNIDSRVRLADYTFDKNDTKSAYAIYKELATLTPKEKLVFKRLNEIALKNNDTKEAILYLKKYLELDPQNAKAYVVLGNLLYDQKDTDGTLDAYRTALKIDPTIKGFYARYGELVVKKGLEDEALKVLNASIAAGEADGTTYITLGNIYQKGKSYASAIKMFQKASDADPKNSAVLTSLAECQAKSGNTSAAIQTYEQVVLINPAAKTEFKELGKLQMKAKKTDDAIKTYEKYLEKVPNDYEIAKTIGMYDYEKKNYNEAITYLSKVKDEKLHTIEYLVSLGQSYYQLKKYAEAAELFALINNKKPSDAVLKEILKPLAECYEKLNKDADAANMYLAYTKLPGVRDADASFKKAFLREKSDKAQAIAMYTVNCKVFSDDYRSFLQLGLLYAQDKTSLTKAAQNLTIASTLKPDDPSILEHLGEVYGKAKNEANELATYKKLLKLNPQNIEANRRVGLLLLKKKQYTDAIINLEIVATISPNDVEIMLSLAEGYMKTKRNDKAIELLAKAKNIKKNDPDIGSMLYTLYKQTGKDKQAESEIKDLIALTKDNKLRIVYAQDLIEQKRFSEASTLVQDIKKTEPTNIEGLMLLGKIQQSQEKLDEAMETYKMISYVNENYAPALYERGNIYFAQKNLERAKSYYEKAIEADAKMVDAYIGYAKTAKLQKDAAGFSKYINKAKALDPNNKEILELSK